MPEQLDPRVSEAVKYYWQTRQRQSAKQAEGAHQDRGSRGAVTGGQQMRAFATLVRDMVVERGLPADAIHWQSRLELPGYFRPTKDWDLFIIVSGRLLAAIEFKSQVGPSFGNNFNNRTEEAIGSAVDLLAAYRAGAFRTFPQPWLGWLMLLEDTERSRAPVKVAEPHYQIFPEFREASYAKRYELLCLRLMRENLYNATCLLVASKGGGLRGEYREPAAAIGFQTFAASLGAQLDAFRDGTTTN